MLTLQVLQIRINHPEQPAVLPGVCTRSGRGHPTSGTEAPILQEGVTESLEAIQFLDAIHGPLQFLLELAFRILVLAVIQSEAEQLQKDGLEGGIVQPGGGLFGVVLDVMELWYDLETLIQGRLLDLGGGDLPVMT